jgi:hypothetical protein
MRKIMGFEKLAIVFSAVVLAVPAALPYIGVRP